MTVTQGSRFKAIAFAAAAAVAVSLLGGLVTDIGPWYAQLKQPPWKPPDWAFGPAWTVIYLFTATAGYLAWRRAPNSAERRNLLALFALNAFLNVLWSVLFFRLQRPDWALIEVAPFWLSILALFLVIRRYAPGPAWLLLPYLAWVAFAATINWGVVNRNAPFG